MMYYPSAIQQALLQIDLWYLLFFTRLVGLSVTESFGFPSPWQLLWINMNLYNAVNPLEVSYINKFVTFNKLPSKATIRIFNIAGHLVNVIEKENNSRFERWNLINLSGVSVTSGIYIVHISMPDEHLDKVLKLVIIMEAEFLDVY